VVGNRGCVVKTAGPIGERIVVAAGSVKATMGRDSFRRGAYNRGPYGRTTFTSRRPTTRMGVTAVFQDAFMAAAGYRTAREGSGEKPAFDPALETLAGVLDGKIPLRVQARKEHDIWSAIRLCGEFGVDFVLEQGIEAYRCVPELKKLGTKVVFGPVFVYPTGYLTRTGEADRPCLNTAGILKEAGLEVALTASDLTGEGSLPHQASFAMKAGLSREDALEAVTAAPARILGVEKRMGMLKAGLDADLVVWSGEPFDPTTRPIAVLVGGKPVYVLGFSESETKDLGTAGDESAE
jgi:imidazolonepropionase-like amidohydrolase